MYDYISIQSDENHSQFISVDDFKNFLFERFNCEPYSNASVYFNFEKFKVKIQGIICEKNGNYNFNNDSSFKKINLIEIHIPPGAEYEEKIIELAKEVSLNFSWGIDWRE